MEVLTGVPRADAEAEAEMMTDDTLAATEIAQRRPAEGMVISTEEAGVRARAHGPEVQETIITEETAVIAMMEMQSDEMIEDPKTMVVDRVEAQREKAHPL
jgi:hypothetical protein